MKQTKDAVQTNLRELCMTAPAGEEAVVAAGKNSGVHLDIRFVQMQEEVARAQVTATLYSVCGASFVNTAAAAAVVVVDNLSDSTSAAWLMVASGRAASLHRVRAHL